MRQQRTRDTEPELALRRALRALGLTFYRKHVPLLGDRRTADIVFRGARVVVDVRGCYWHGCPQHSRRGTSNAEWWTDKIATNVRRDADTEQQLREAGWLVHVVWEHDDPAAAADRIAELVRERQQAVRGTRAAASDVLPPEGGTTSAGFYSSALER
jgi:DNA mismatch endonuclease (patch repair protein)